MAGATTYLNPKSFVQEETEETENFPDSFVLSVSSCKEWLGLEPKVFRFDDACLL